MIKKIKNCLNNETGGPNLETLIAVGFALSVMTAIFHLGRILWETLHAMPGTPISKKSEDWGNGDCIIQGYNYK